jgi:hypothetical protein
MRQKEPNFSSIVDISQCATGQAKAQLTSNGSIPRGQRLSLRGVKRRSNLIFGGTGILPVILIDRLEARPTMEIATA